MFNHREAYKSAPILSVAALGLIMLAAACAPVIAEKTVTAPTPATKPGNEVELGDSKTFARRLGPGMGTFFVRTEMNGNKNLSRGLGYMVENGCIFSEVVSFNQSLQEPVVIAKVSNPEECLPEAK